MKLIPNSKDPSWTAEECRSSIARDLEIEINSNDDRGNVGPEFIPEQGQTSENVVNYLPPLPVITIVLRILQEKNPPRENVDEEERREVLPQEMTSAWRVISFFFVIFVLPTILISVPLYARYKLYSAQTLYFTNGDMHSMHQDVSRFWCQGQKIYSNGTFEAFLTHQPQRLSLKKSRRTMKLSSELLFQEDDVEQWGFYLIKGSRFRFSSCARWPGGTLLVVKGEENLRRCFYREEKFEELLKDPKVPTYDDDILMGKVEPAALRMDSSEVDGGGEVLEDGEGDNWDIGSIYNKRRFKKRPNSSLNEDDVTQSDDVKNRKTNPTVNSITTEQTIVANTTERLTTKNRTPDLIKTIRVPVHTGLFSYNESDTLDVTAGNSSYSSSEEFLSHCRDTLVSIDLMPYIDCKAKINKNDPENTWNFTVNESDFYYFIFFSDNSIETNVISFRLKMIRALYDVSENAYEQKCSNSSECSFPFSFLKAGGVIVDYGTDETPITKLENLETFELTSICQPRSIVYTVFILLVPFIIFLFAFR